VPVLHRSNLYFRTASIVHYSKVDEAIRFIPRSFSGPGAGNLRFHSRNKTSSLTHPIVCAGTGFALENEGTQGFSAMGTFRPITSGKPKISLGTPACLPRR